jgi:hypothetical protein
MNLSRIQTELTHATSGPWEENGQGMIINSNTQKIIGFCSSDTDARLVVTLRNEAAELLEQLDESYSAEQYAEICQEYDDEIEGLKDQIDDMHTKEQYDQMVSAYDKRIEELEQSK